MKRITDAARALLAGMAAYAGTACSDDDPTDNAGSIQVAVTPATLSVSPGGSSAVTVELTRGGGFSGDVTLAVSGLPTGVSTTITPPELTGTTASATIDVAVALSVAAGIYVATVTATAQGAGQATATYQLTVTEPAPVDVEYQFCHDDAPSMLAWQDGSGAWQLLNGTPAGDTTRYEFTITQGRGGVMLLYHDPIEPVRGLRPASHSMMHRQAAVRDRMSRDPGRSVGSSLIDVYQTLLIYASAAELALEGEANCEAGAVSTKAVTGTVTSVPEGSYGIISLGSANLIFDGAAATNPVTFSEVEDGPVDLIGSRTIPGAVPDRLIVIRDVNAPNGGSLPVPIDFSGAATSAPATASATITGGGGHDLEIFVTVVTAKAEAGLWFELTSSPSTSRMWAGLGPSVLTASGVHGLIVFASPPGHPGDFRVAGRYVGPVSNQTLALGPTIASPATSQIDAGPYPRFRFQGTLPPDYNRSFFLDLVGPGGCSPMGTPLWLPAPGYPGPGMAWRTTSPCRTSPRSRVFRLTRA